jgi:uncharacterized coiled-coil DUF342 family protein
MPTAATNKAAKKAAATSEDKPKRTRKMLSPDEKIAKLEADLAAARAKKDEKAGKARKDLVTKRDKVAAKRDELNKQVLELDAEIERLDASPATADEGAGA